MLPSTEEEKTRVVSYMEWQAPDRTVEFLQKVYSEAIIDHRHDVWDVHTDQDRWWVITNPTNLYSQQQFPNMDLALTFHVGLCIRVPRSQRPSIADLPVEPLAECFRNIREAADAVAQAGEIADYQAIGVRCREALLAFAAVARRMIPWAEDREPPKKGDFKAWVDNICGVILRGGAQEYRRQLFKSLLVSAWTFSNWLTHAKNSHWHDAEAAVAAVENAVTLSASALLVHVRGVPPSCPACGSQRLEPLRAVNPDDLEEVWERPACTKCEWTGQPVKIEKAVTLGDLARPEPEGECVSPTVPLRRLEKPE